MSSSHRALAAIGYIPALFWIPLFLSGGDDFARHHGRQGLVIFVFWILTILVFGLLHFLTGWVKPIQVVVDFVQGALYVLYVVLSVWGALKAAGGERWRVPVLGAYSDRLKL